MEFSVVRFLVGLAGVVGNTWNAWHIINDDKARARVVAKLVCVFLFMVLVFVAAYFLLSGFSDAISHLTTIKPDRDKLQAKRSMKSAPRGGQS